MRILLIVVFLIAAGIGGAYVFGAGLVRDGVIDYGPDALNVPVELESVSLNPLTGEGSVKGFALGHPETFGEGNMIRVGEIGFDVRMNTLLSNHIIIDSLVIDNAFVEGRLKDTSTNLQTFVANLPSATTAGSAGPTPTTPAGAEAITMTIKRLDFIAPQISVTSKGLLEAAENVTLESFNLTDLGTDEKGLAPSEIARHVMDVLGPQVARVVASKQVQGKLDDLKDKALDKVNEAGKGLLNSLTKRKKKDGSP